MRAVFPHAWFKSAMVGMAVASLAYFEPGLAVLAAAAACLARASARPRATRLSARWLHEDASHERWRARVGGVERVLMARAEGPLLFASAPDIDALLPERAPWPAYLLLDVRAVSELDGSACAALLQLCACVEARSGRMVWVARPGSDAFSVLQRTGLAGRGLGETLCFDVEHALDRIARAQLEQSEQATPPRAIERRTHLRLLPAPLDGVR